MKIKRKIHQNTEEDRKPLRSVDLTMGVRVWCTDWYLHMIDKVNTGHGTGAEDGNEVSSSAEVGNGLPCDYKWVVSL